MTTHIDFIARHPGKLMPSVLRNKHLFPLFVFKRELRQRGVHIHYYPPDRLPKHKHKILCLDSRCFSYRYSRLDESDLELISNFRANYEYILWFDFRDSSGTTQFEVLPFVDKYCKKQLLRDRQKYMGSFYGSRIYTDYYYRHDRIEDPELDHHAIPLDLKDLDRLYLSWNLAYSDFRSNGRLGRYINVLFRRRAPQVTYSSNRPISLLSRFYTGYNSNLIKYQRQSLLDALQSIPGFEVQTSRISLAAYQDELKRTLAVLSPFGWGEICYRDFEAMIFGCALLKPDISHIETWPDLFIKDITYLPLSWDIKVAALQISEALKNRDHLLDNGRTGQQYYIRIWNQQGAKDFCDHFERLITF